MNVPIGHTLDLSGLVGRRMSEFTAAKFVALRPLALSHPSFARGCAHEFEDRQSRRSRTRRWHRQPNRSTG
jgi:hypothetical protein